MVLSVRAPARSCPGHQIASDCRAKLYRRCRSLRFYSPPNGWSPDGICRDHLGDRHTRNLDDQSVSNTCAHRIPLCLEKADLAGPCPAGDLHTHSQWTKKQGLVNEARGRGLRQPVPPCAFPTSAGASGLTTSNRRGRPLP